MDFIPLTEFIATYRPASLDNWSDLTQAFLNNEFDRENIEIIRGDIRSGTGIREPVQVAIDSKVCLSGQHRVVAGILEELDDIPYSKEERSEQRYPEIVITVELPHDVIEDCLDGPLAAAFRSFHVEGSFWTECFLALEGNTLILTLDCPSEFQEKLLLLVAERLERIGIQSAIQTKLSD